MDFILRDFGVWYGNGGGLYAMLAAVVVVYAIVVALEFRRNGGEGLNSFFCRLSFIFEI